MSIFAGSTPKYRIRLKDEAGTQLNPEDTGQILEVKIWIYNSISGDVVAKFYLNDAPDPIGTWRQAGIKEIVPGDKQVHIYLTTSETEEAAPDMNIMQVAVTVPDADFADGKRIIVKKGRFHDIKYAKLILS